MSMTTRKHWPRGWASEQGLIIVHSTNPSYKNFLKHPMNKGDESPKTGKKLIMLHFSQTTCVAGVAMRSICLKLVLWSWN